MTHEVHLPNINQVIAKAGTQPGGRTQMFFTNELRRLSDPYVPMGAGVLKNSSRVVDNHTALEYHTPYAQYHWYGKLMVDAVTGSSWARAGTQKVLTERDMSYRGGPIRGPRWVNRAYEDNKEALLQSVEKVANQ